MLIGDIPERNAKLYQNSTALIGGDNAKPKEVSMYALIERTARVLAAALLALVSVAALAQGAFPSKPLTIVIPYTPGGIGDLFGRALGQRLQISLGQPVIIENRPGASQMIGALAVARAPADGYTLFFGATGSLAMNVYTKKDIRYDPVKDFAPVSQVTNMPLFVVASPELAATNIKELIALLKANPKKYSFASIGEGSSTHMAAVLFMMLTGTDMIHVPYKSTGPGITDVMAGRVSISFVPGGAVLPSIKSGKLRLLAVSTKQRFSAMPDVPTIAEAGVSDYDISVWNAIVAPAGTPPAVTTKLSQEISRILRMPEMRERFASFGIDLTPSTPDELSAMIKSEIKKWSDVLRHAGIKPN